MKQFKATNGHCKVTGAENKELSQWVSRQRNQYGLFQTGKKCALNQHRIGLLDSIEFVWNTRKRKKTVKWYVVCCADICDLEIILLII